MNSKKYQIVFSAEDEYGVRSRRAAPEVFGRSDNEGQ